jgi:hypothetical protein
MHMPTGKFLAAAGRPLVVAAALLAMPGVADASQALSRGQRIGSLSAKLLQKPYDTLTATQQSQVICDPVEPTEGSTSFFYDRGWASEFLTTRISIKDVVAGPKYTITGGLVEVIVFTGVPSAATFGEGRAPRAPFFRLFQNLDDFLAEPAGEETGFAQIFYERNDDAEAPSRMSPFDETFELKQTVGEVPGGVDTHAFLFETKPGTPEGTEIPLTHFASEGITPVADLLAYEDELGRFEVGPGADGDSELTEATVTAPEPGAVALLAVGALGLLRRRRRNA